MPRAKGTPKTGGRKKGTPNKLPSTVKQAIMAAFEEVGGAAYLVRVAQEDPKSFATLLGKLLPTEVAAKVEGGLELTVVSGIDAVPGGANDSE